MAGGMMLSGPGGRCHEYNRGRITTAVLLAAFVGACCGLVFGYDIGIAGGVTTYQDFQRRFFPAVLEPHGADTAFCKYDDPLLTFFVSVLFLTGIVGAFIGSYASNHWGRRITMMLGGCGFLAGAALMAPAVHISMLILGRAVMGLGVGICVQAGPLFLSELAPAHLRGAFNTQFQLFVTIGILLAQLVNYANQHYEQGWRINLGLAGVPALLVMVGAALAPETPTFLAERGTNDQARATLQKIRGVEDVEVEYEDLVDGAAIARHNARNQWREFFSRRHVPQLIIISALQIFNQLDGINAIMFYTPQLFNAVGSSTQQGLFVHVVIGAVNVVTTLVAVITVDRLGRRFWLLEASTHMCVCQVIMGVVIARYLNPITGTMPHGATIVLIVTVCVFVAGHAWGWGPIPFLIASEVTTMHTRPAATAWSTIVQFLLSFVISQCFLGMLCTMRAYVFFFFAGWLFVMGVFVFVFVPETRGVPLELVEERFREHWVWGKVCKIDKHARGGDGSSSHAPAKGDVAHALQ